MGRRKEIQKYNNINFLFEQLVKLKKSKKQLADEIGVDKATISRWTKTLNLPVNFHSRSNIGKIKPVTLETKGKISKTVKQQYINGRIANGYKGRQIKECEVCGKEFEVVANSKWQRRTCSYECKNKLHSLYMTKNVKRATCVSLKCQQCGKEFKVAPSLRHLKFCSYDCSHLWREGKNYAELYGEEKSRDILNKLAVSRSKQIGNFFTKPVKKMVDELIPIFGQPELEYVIDVWTVDICYPNLKLVIEVDGNYWHNYPKGLSKDRYKTKKLEELEWKVFRFWESDILSNAKNICIEIQKRINNVNIKE